jgi:hypothetical protein
VAPLAFSLYATAGVGRPAAAVAALSLAIALALIYRRLSALSDDDSGAGAVDEALDEVSDAAKEITESTSPGDGEPAADAEPPPSTDRLLIAVAELTAAVAAFTVAQSQERRESLLKAFLLPIVLVVIAALVPAASLIREAANDDEVDCVSYINAVVAIGGDEATSDTLDGSSTVSSSTRSRRSVVSRSGRSSRAPGRSLRSSRPAEG